MTGAEFKAARQQMGLSQKDMALALRLGAHGWQSISGWENGHFPVPGPVQVALEHMLAVEQIGPGAP